MIKRFFIVVLLSTLVCTLVFDQGFCAYGPESSHRSFLISGTLMSPYGSVAIVNGKMSREGDRVDGAEILSIESGAVRIRFGSREFKVSMGLNTVEDQSSSPSRWNKRRSGTSQDNPEPKHQASSVPSQAPVPGRFDTDRHYGPVKRGETLSGIAKQYLSDGITMNQIMIALFHANPKAFSGNINILYEGAVLRIPDRDVLGRQVRETAAEEFARQHIDWQKNYPQKARLTEVTSKGRYGPVKSGESLSLIAKSLLRDGITMNQMMIALYQANPQAFSGNINILYEGAVLRIPDESELLHQEPETATAEVLRQTQAWLTGA